MKVNKIKGGIYSGKYWYEFHTSQYAKHCAHKQERQRAKRFVKQMY